MLRRAGRGAGNWAHVSESRTRFEREPLLSHKVLLPLLAGAKEGNSTGEKVFRVLRL